MLSQEIQQQKWENYCNRNSKVFSIGDSQLNRINKKNFWKEFKGDWVSFKCFAGANTKQLHKYSIPILVDEKPNTSIIHIGPNNITKSNYHIIHPDELAKRIVNIGLKSKYYGVGRITISSILAKSNNDLNKVKKQINFSLRSLCEAYGFAFICNRNIYRNRLWRDGIHLKNEGTSLLSKNVLEHLNSSSEHLANPSEYEF